MNSVMTATPAQLLLSPWCLVYVLASTQVNSYMERLFCSKKKTCVYVCISACTCVGTNMCGYTITCICAYMCRGLMLMPNTFFDHSLPYILRQGHLLNPYLASFSLPIYLACHGRGRLPRERIPRVLPCPPDHYLGVGGLRMVPCAYATSIVSIGPAPWLLGGKLTKERG